MNIRYSFLIIGIVLVSCTSATVTPEAVIPASTTLPGPTVTPSEEKPAEIPPTPTLAPTNTPPATPTQIPTDTPIPIQFNLDWYENNPVLDKGSSSDWDYWRVLEGDVIQIDDVFHMFYTGISENSMGIGYAVSTDGIEFTKHDTNPIFQSDGEGFDAKGVVHATPLFVDNLWMIFYNAIAPDESFVAATGGGSSIGLTTAPEPIGPWTAGQQVLKAGEDGEWDSGYLIPSSVIVTEDGYRMYYNAGPDTNQFPPEMMCGMATSLDGINWTKFNDPSTTEAPFAESDPVMQPGTGWDSLGIFCSVLKTDAGWEMFYEGWNAISSSEIGYASSPDGINWLKYQENPLLGAANWTPSSMKVGPTYFVYAHNHETNTLFIATGTIDQP